MTPASRSTGRHRSTGQRPSTLFMDYPGGSIPRGGTTPLEPPYEVFRIPYPRRGPKRPLAVVAVIALAFIVAGAILGGIALTNSPDKTSAMNAVPGISLPPLPQPAASSATPSARPVTHPHRTVHKQPAVVAQAPPVTAHVTPARKTAGPPIAVSYHVDGQWSNGFQGEVDVTNNTTSPIADWQIVVALYGDVVTSVRNATGFFNNGILLLRPGPSGHSVAPYGGRIRVSFTAEGFRTIPVACAFNGTLCVN